MSLAEVLAIDTITMTVEQKEIKNEYMKELRG